MKNKRFIAGAQCPACAQVDKIYTYEEEGQQWRACASCDFRESMQTLVSPPGLEELPTRVNQHKPGEQPLAHETPVEKVNLLLSDPPQKK